MSDPAGAVPPPLSTPETEHIWDGYRRGEIVLQRCDGCAALRFLPAQRCAACGAMTWSPVAASGRGTVYSYIVTHRPAVLLNDEFPVIVLVELEEGPRLISNLVGVDPADVGIGMPVIAQFDPHDGLTLARFRPTDASAVR